MSIDWSKAPEWATHHGYVGIGLCEVWLEVWLNDCQYTYVDGKQGGRVFSFAAKEGWEVDEIINVSPRPGMPKWTGEGLPPVGVECEANMPPNGMRKEYEWRLVKVVHGGIPGAEREVLVFDVENTYPAWVDEFRPIRTPEQIAAEEREKAIRKMMTFLGGDGDELRNAFGRMYDAGYRLVEGGAQ